LPFSATISLARESAFAVISSNVRRRHSPSGQCVLGRADRVERVIHGPVRYLGHRVLGGRVDHRERAAASPAGPLPADQQASRYFDADQFGQICGHGFMSPSDP
jgi:hypothetical protein